MTSTDVWVKKASDIFSSGRIEAAAAMINFAASSLYWLALAFAMPPGAYGKMMTLQAAVLIVVTIFTLRTHDLFFNLIVQSDYPASVAYRKTLRIEIAAASAGTIFCLSAALIYPLAANDPAVAGIATYAFLASFGAVHGASIGKLRYQTRGDMIAKIDLLTALSWGAACISIPFMRHLPLVVPLIIGAIPTAIRTACLILSAHAVASEPVGAPAEEGVGIARAPVMGFLAGAQVTNFLKNASIPIETLILAAIAGPATVAMYRVARATQGSATAVLNVLYQRIYPDLARAGSLADRKKALRRLQRNSLLACGLIFPLSAAIALGYALLKPEVGIIELQLITTGTFLALLPSACQQGPFAVLSLAGDHRSAGLAYIYSFVFLGLASLLLLVWPRVEIFMAGLIGGAFIRFWYLRAKSYRAIGALAQAGVVGK